MHIDKKMGNHVEKPMKKTCQQDGCLLNPSHTFRHWKLYPSKQKLGIEVGYRSWIQKLGTEFGYRSWVQKLGTENGY